MYPHISIILLNLDPKQPYCGSVDYNLITFREATNDEVTSLTPSTPESIVLYKSFINAGLQLPLTPLVRGILSWFDMAPCQVNANFYRAISVASASIPYLRKDLVLTPELFINCYKLGRKVEGNHLKLFACTRHHFVAAPGGVLPSSDKMWATHPFVASGPWWQSRDRDEVQIRSVPNLELDFGKPPPQLTGKDATAFRLIQRGGNPKYEKFLKIALCRKKVLGPGSSSSVPAQKMKNPGNICDEKTEEHASTPIGNSGNTEIFSSSEQAISKKKKLIQLDSSSSFAREVNANGTKQIKSTDPSAECISRAMRQTEIGTKLLRDECRQLKGQLGELKKHCNDLKVRTDSDAMAIAQLRNEKDELETLLKRSKIEIASNNLVIRDLQSSVKKLEAFISEGMLNSSNQKEPEKKLEEAEVDRLRLHNIIFLAEETCDADIERARLAGYNNGVIEGRRMARKEYADLQKRDLSV